jgi:plasmid stabilization system protein ParE
MIHRVVLTARAERDRDEAFAWYAGNYSREFAVRWYDGLARAAQTLEQTPLRCAKAHESTKFPFEVRELLFGKGLHKHRILFTLHEELVLVLHIRHSARRDFAEDDI